MGKSNLSEDLRNAVVTGDALHCKKENMQLVVENDGDFLFQLKGSQPEVAGSDP